MILQLKKHVLPYSNFRYLIVLEFQNSDTIK